MKRTLVFILLLVSCAASAQMSEHVRQLASPSFQGRGAGTDGEKAAAVYMAEQFQKLGADLLYPMDGDTFGIRLENGDTLTSRNVAAVISGYDKALKDKYIVIGARLDNIGKRMVTVNGESREQIYPGANGNASGLAMLLELASNLSINKVLLKRSVILVAFGASSQMNAGSWYFLNRSFAHVQDIDAMINLDMVGTGSSGLYAYTGSNADLNNRLDALKATLQPVHPRIVTLEPVPSDHRSFYGSRIPSVMFTTGMYPEYNSVRDVPAVVEEDWMERVQEYVFNFCVALANGEKPEFEASATKKEQSPRDGVVAFSECEVKPSFLGSQNPETFLKKWVYQYLKYPQKALEDGIQGRVLVNFVIDDRGKVRDARVLRGVHPLLDEEALKVVNASPDWKPGRLHGKKVSTELSVYVVFKLEKKKR